MTYSVAILIATNNAIVKNNFGFLTSNRNKTTPRAIATWILALK